MLKKAGTVAAITAGLMLLGSAAFAEASAPNAVGRMGLLAPPRDFVVGSGVSDLNTLFGFAAFSSATGDNPSGYATFRNGGGDRSGEVEIARVLSRIAQTVCGRTPRALLAPSSNRPERTTGWARWPRTLARRGPRPRRRTRHGDDAPPPSCTSFAAFLPQDIPWSTQMRCGFLHRIVCAGRPPGCLRELGDNGDSCQCFIVCRRYRHPASPILRCSGGGGRVSGCFPTAACDAAARLQCHQAVGAPAWERAADPVQSRRRTDCGRNRVPRACPGPARALGRRGRGGT